MANDNPMRKLRIEKVTVNIGVGEAGENLEKARKLVEKLTGKTPTLTIARKRQQTFGIRKGDNIGVKVTIRGDDAEAFLKRALEAKDMKISKRAFDKFGNFSFGLKEYLDFPGVRYDPSIGLIGFDVCVTLKRAGFRIADRKRKKSKLPIKQRGTMDEALQFVKEKFKIEIVE